MIKIYAVCNKCEKEVFIDETNEKDLEDWAQVNVYDDHCMYITKMYCPDCISKMIKEDEEL